MRLRTALCDLLGIEYPIVQSGMGSVAGPDMVAEVSRAGGLGVLGALGVPPDELRARIRRVRSLTDRPFGVNLWLHSELRPPVPASQLPDAAVHAVQSALNRFRERLEVPATQGRPADRAVPIEAALEVMLEERTPVFSTGVGLPDAAMVNCTMMRPPRSGFFVSSCS